MKRSLFWLLDHYPETGETVAEIHAAAVEHAVEADRLGFESLWLSEHHFLNLSTSPNPAVLLAAIAQRTKRIRLGPATAVLPLRDPIHVAEDYALVDVLSGGRLNLGVGSGSQAREFEPFGVDFGRRRELYADRLATIRARWHTASTGQVGASSLNVGPIQSPPPIYVATTNADRAYQVGRDGDSLLTIVSPTAEGLEDSVARIRAHERGQRDEHSAGRNESIVMMFAYVAQAESEVDAEVVPALGRLMEAMTGEKLADPRSLYDQMRRRGTGLFGTPSQVDRQLEQLADRGVRHVAFVSRFGGMPADRALRSMAFLAAKNRPARESEPLNASRNVPPASAKTASRKLPVVRH